MINFDDCSLYVTAENVLCLREVDDDGYGILVHIKKPVYKCDGEQIWYKKDYLTGNAFKIEGGL